MARNFGAVGCDNVNTGCRLRQLFDFQSQSAFELAKFLRYIIHQYPVLLNSISISSSLRTATS